MNKMNKNVETIDERGKKHELRNNLADLVGQKVEFEGVLTKCYEDTQKLLIREINDTNGQYVTKHCHMFINGNKNRQKDKERIDKMFQELQKIEGRRVKFVGKVTQYSTKSQKINYGISYFVKLIDII